MGAGCAEGASVLWQQELEHQLAACWEEPAWLCLGLQPTVKMLPESLVLVDLAFS